MPNTSSPPQSDRREFLRQTLALGAGAAVAAAAPALAITEPLATDPAPASPQGYHVTAHIEAYYRSAAF